MATPEASRAMDVVILAGGLGTRLQPIGGDIPKPLRPVNGRPFLAYLIDQVRAAGLTRIILALGYKPEAFTEFARQEGLEVSVEATPLGTGGALRAALPLLRTHFVMVLNGDSYAHVDLRLLAALPRRRHARALLLLAEAENAGRYGRVDIDENGAVERFAEKSETGPGLVNAGVYILEHSVIAAIPADRAVSLERETFPSLIGTGIFGEPGGFPFLDIGTPESYAACAAFFEKTKGIR